MVALALMEDADPTLRGFMDSFRGSPEVYTFPLPSPIVPPLLYTVGIGYLLNQPGFPRLLAMAGLGPWTSKLRGLSWINWRVEVRLSCDAVLLGFDSLGFERYRVKIAKSSFPLGWFEWITLRTHTGQWLALLKSEEAAWRKI